MVYKGLSGCLSGKDSGTLEESPQDLSAGKKVSGRRTAKRDGLRLLRRAHFLFCLLQVELELEALKKQQASTADSSSLATKEEVSILR